VFYLARLLTHLNISLYSMPYATPNEPYSPKWVEEMFSEVRRRGL
jgi:hypothetical protein